MTKRFANLDFFALFFFFFFFSSLPVSTKLARWDKALDGAFFIFVLLYNDGGGFLSVISELQTSLGPDR
jgi:hypothetical protein